MFLETKYVGASASICCFDSDSYFLHMLAGSEAVGEEMSVCQHAAWMDCREIWSRHPRKRTGILYISVINLN